MFFFSLLFYDSTYFNFRVFNFVFVFFRCQQNGRLPWSSFIYRFYVCSCLKRAWIWNAELIPLVQTYCFFRRLFAKYFTNQMFRVKKKIRETCCLFVCSKSSIYKALFKTWWPLLKIWVNVAIKYSIRVAWAFMGVKKVVL
jgi:hypothetical protein